MPTGGQSAAAAQREGKASLVDIAEEALRAWLATGRHRPGERLPPEQELSAHLGISRGTLRTALQRLEDTGEIVRRQGSGTYVGRAVSTSLDEGLEKLVSYSSLARERGVKLEVGDLTWRSARCEPRPQSSSASRPTPPATQVTRVLLMDGEPGAWMRDVVHPDVELPSAARIKSQLEKGEMVLDILLKQGVPVAYTRAHITARVLTKRDRIGQGTSRRRPSSRPGDRPRDLHGRRHPGRAQHRHLPAAKPGPARDAVAGGHAARAGDWAPSAVKLLHF